MKNNNLGIALILCVGILSILALVIIGFAGSARMSLKATENYADQLKAELVAESAIAFAIKELKYSLQGAVNTPYDTCAEDWFYGDDVNVDLADAAAPSFNNFEKDNILGIYKDNGNFKLKIIDCASQINLNYTNELMLENLSDQIGSTLSARITAKREELGGSFSTKQEIKLVSGMGEKIYQEIKDYLTLYGSTDEDNGISSYVTGGSADLNYGHSAKVFVNVNTARKKVLEAVLLPIVNSSELITHLINYRKNNPFDGKNGGTSFSCARGELNCFFESEKKNGFISDAELANLLKYTDPNQYEYNDSTGATIDQTPTTYLCFDSGGYYEIEAIGEYNGAKKRIKKIVKLYEKIVQTSRKEFQYPYDPKSASTSDPKLIKTNYQDDCPLNYGCLNCFKFNRDPLITGRIKDSLKLGFWDDFEDSDFSKNIFRSFEKKTHYIVGNSVLSTQKRPGYASHTLCPIVILGEGDSWRWKDVSVIVHIQDEDGKSLVKDSERKDFPLPLRIGNRMSPTKRPAWCEQSGTKGPIWQRTFNVGQLLLYYQAIGAWNEDHLMVVATNAQQQKNWWPEDVGTDGKSICWYYDIPSQKFSENFLMTLKVQNKEHHAIGYQSRKTIHTLSKLKSSPTVETTGDLYYNGAEITGVKFSTGGLAVPNYVTLYGSNNLPDFDY
ncbi:MAG: hypothetical protein DRP78_06725, partial [Candidatus Omnitrophota bacterium]